jgi:hypothetical protein
VYIDRLLKYLGVNKEDLIQILPPNRKEQQPWKNAPLTVVGFFKDADEVNRFLAGLDELKQRQSTSA